jgi:hypothetical protein
MSLKNKTLFITHPIMSRAQEEWCDEWCWPSAPLFLRSAMWSTNRFHRPLLLFDWVCISWFIYGLSDTTSVTAVVVWMFCLLCFSCGPSLHALSQPPLMSPLRLSSILKVCKGRVVVVHPVCWVVSSAAGFSLLWPSCSGAEVGVVGSVGVSLSFKLS